MTLAAAQAATTPAPAPATQLCLRRKQWRLSSRGMTPERDLPSA
ncbi:MAG: hypothetical protein U0325_32690 [Polyangiales bacterium]